MSRIQVIHDDALDVLRTLDDNSVDAVVTDPPYELGFMGKRWDGTGIAYNVELWAECLRVLKPGGHLLSFGGSRTWHRLAAAVEDAGFEIRDSIAWLYGSGFPKSHDVSKAIDKAAGAERAVVGPSHRHSGRSTRAGSVSDFARYGTSGDVTTAPATNAARQWQGWGTALKPGFEPIVVGRKPFAGTVAANVLAHGTGALNIDACRLAPGEGGTRAGEASAHRIYTNGIGGDQNFTHRPGPRGGSADGRWPANVVLDDGAATELDEQTGVTRSSGTQGDGAYGTGVTYGDGRGQTRGLVVGYGDVGGASRFFPVFRYQAKAPRSERPKVDGVAHPTVKPLALMRWLVRLVTPPDGLVLDPFAGSGTTGEACALEGFRCLLIEREADYIPLIHARIARTELEAS